MQDKIMIIGNGPSLRSFNFQRLNGIDTLGMNAAYRHWDRIDWYPDHYCCLDPELIETHWREIKRLVEKGQVKTAFLFGNFLEFHPQAAEDERYIFLDQFIRYWYQENGEKFGLDFYSAPIFKSSEPDKLTTGSHAVRYAVFLGYQEVGLIGIDLKYVEQIDASINTSGIKLEMQKTPAANPNYFFDDYQQKGDKYQIPNPAEHNHDLHAASFVVLREDLVRLQANVNIVNCNKHSVMFEQGIFPYRRARQFLAEPALTSLVMMTQVGELQQILDCLQLWESSEYIPFLHLQQRKQPALVISITGKPNQEFETAITRMFESSHVLNNSFSSLECRFIDLSPEDDVYIRDYSKSAGPKGYKSGPNHQFFYTVKSLFNTPGYAYFIETDCVPIRPDWLGFIYDLVASSENFWIMGSAYKGVSTLSWKYSRHINGSAIYATGDKAFQAFVARWEEITAHTVREDDPRLAYDCVIENLYSKDIEALNKLPTNVLNRDYPGWLLYQELSAKLKYSEFILNLSGPADAYIASLDSLRQLREGHEQTVLVHNRKLTELLITNNQLPAGAWRATSATTAEGMKTPRLLVIDSFPAGYPSATGQVKSMFVENWDEKSLLQVCINPVDKTPCLISGLSEGADLPKGQEIDDIVQKCREFAPQVIYFRPNESALIFTCAEEVISSLNCPLVIHMMDDWPEKLRARDPKSYNKLNPILKKLVQQAVCCMSISEKMSVEFYQRYGKIWYPFANAVKVSDYPLKHNNKPAGETFIIRYSGALADDMTFNSVRDVAETVAELQGKFNLQFEIFTMQWCLEKAKVLNQLDGVIVNVLVSKEGYVDSLCSADALLITYNFDLESMRYTRLSLANKMPECLASGSAVLAYGPASVATIDYLEKSACAIVVSRRDSELLKAAITRLIEQPAARKKQGIAARRFVARHLNKQKVQNDFLSVIRSIEQQKAPSSGTLVGPFIRTHKAHYDETLAIAELFSQQENGALMIDVGAHHGGAMFPFLELGWQVYAFEPDKNNRKTLRARLDKSSFKSQALIDNRCVTDRIELGKAFYTSSQSTGISGLSVFHESHELADQVDTITLSEYFKDVDLENLNFLKVDTEGFDLFVLKGYPWERTHPQVIECEFEDNKTVPLGYNFHDLANFLLVRGYSVYVSEWHPVVRYGIAHDWRSLSRYPCELNEPGAWGNIIAFKQPVDEKILVSAVEQVLRINNPELPVKGYRMPVQPGVPITAPEKTVIPEIIGEQKVTPKTMHTQSKPAPQKEKAKEPEVRRPPVIRKESRLRLDAQWLSSQVNMQPEELTDNGLSFSWSGADPVIQFELSLDRTRVLFLGIEIIALIKSRFSKRINVLVDGIKVKTSFHHNVDRYLLAGELSADSRKGKTIISIVLPATYSPAELNAGADSRKLGIAIHQLNIRPVN